MYSLIWLCWVLGVELRVFDLHHSLWGPVTWAGVEPRPPALGARNLSYWTTRGPETELLDLQATQMYSHQSHKCFRNSDLNAYGNAWSCLKIGWLNLRTHWCSPARHSPHQPWAQLRFQRRQIQQKKERGTAQRTGAGVFLHRILQEGKDVSYAPHSWAIATGRSVRWLRSHNMALAPSTTRHPDKPNTKLPGSTSATRTAGNSTLMCIERVSKWERSAQGSQQISQHSLEKQVASIILMKCCSIKSMVVITQLSWWPIHAHIWRLGQLGSLWPCA